MYAKPTFILALISALVGGCQAPPAAVEDEPVICDPQARSCSGNDVVACHGTGTSWSFFKACREFGPCLQGVCSKEPTPDEAVDPAADASGSPGGVADPTDGPAPGPSVDPGEGPAPDPADPGVTPGPDPVNQPEPCACAGRQVCEDSVCGEPEVCQGDVDCIGEGRACVQGECRSVCAGDQECFGDFVCDADTRRCQPAAGCLRDGCADGGRCDGSTGQCIAAEQVQCHVSSDCPGAQGCRAGSCIEPIRCGAAIDCLGDRICDQGVCADSCVQAGCAGDLRCDAALGVCTEQGLCASDAGCRQGRICLDGGCVEACAEHADCPGAQVCDRGQCVDPGFCLLDGDCGERRICEGGACIDSCVVRDCAIGGVCDVASGRCQGDLRCAEAADCPGALTCLAGSCVEPAGCGGDAGCLPGRVCRAGACTDTCDADAECGGELACVDGVCEAPGACQIDGDCPDGLRCAAGQCFVPECDAHDQCGTGFCTDFACAAGVAGRCDCEDGWDCRDGRCLQPGPCEVDGDCAAGTICLANTGACATLCDGPDCAGDAECVEDRFFPNDAPGDALAIGAMHLAGLTACPRAADWYRVHADGAFSAVARFDRVGQPVTLRLYDAANPISALDEHTGGTGESWVSASAGDWLVRIAGPVGAGVAYELDVVARGGCADDGFERPFRNDDPDRAAVVGMGSHAGRACADDVDFFAWRGGAATLSIEGAGVTGELADGTPLPARIAGPALVRVTPIGEGGDYSLVIDAVRDPAGRCAAAPAIEPDAPVHVAFDGDPADGDDFAPQCLGQGEAERVFRLELAEAGGLTARWAGELPTTRIAIYGADCELAPVVCVAGPEPATIQDAEAGTYFIVVDGPDSGTLTVTAGGAGGGGDANACDAPAAIALGVPTEVTPGAAPGHLVGGCLEDNVGEAAVTFNIDATSDIRVTATTGGAPVTASIRRADCADEAAEQECAAGFDPVAEARAQPAGSYFAIVEGADDVVTLTVEAFPAATFTDACAGDAAPLSPARALDVAGDTSLFADSVDGTACGGEAGGRDATLRFTLDAPAVVTAQVTSTDGDFAALLSLFAGGACDGAPTECGTLIGSTVQAELPAGTHAVVFDGSAADASGAFTVSVTASQE